MIEEGFRRNPFEQIRGQRREQIELLKTDVFHLLENSSNDLEKPAISSLPLISKILTELKNHQAKIAKMSGSGASCFAIFEDEKSLRLSAEFFAENFPNFLVRKVNILSRF